MPEIPQKAAGCLIEPPVSEPVAKGTNPAAIAAAEPPEEPPGTCSYSMDFLRTKIAVFIGRTHGKFIHVGFTQGYYTALFFNRLTIVA